MVIFAENNSISFLAIDRSVNLVVIDKRDKLTRQRNQEFLSEDFHDREWRWKEQKNWKAARGYFAICGASRTYDRLPSPPESLTTAQRLARRDAMKNVPLKRDQTTSCNIIKYFSLCFTYSVIDLIRSSPV